VAPGVEEDDNFVSGGATILLTEFFLSLSLMMCKGEVSTAADRSDSLNEARNFGAAHALVADPGSKVQDAEWKEDT
jgi:hypothetical protein